MSKLRKKRVRKEKDKLSNIIIIFIIMTMAVIITISMLVLSTKSNAEELTISEEKPDVMGEVMEKNEESIIIQPMVRGEDSVSYDSSENVTISRDTQIFLMNRRDDAPEHASRLDIKLGSRIAVWGERINDGTWRATDIGIMLNNPRRPAKIN